MEKKKPHLKTTKKTTNARQKTPSMLASKLNHKSTQFLKQTPTKEAKR